MTLLARFCTDQEDFLTASTTSVVSLCFDRGISSRYVQQSRQNVLVHFLGASTVVCALVTRSRWVLSCLRWHTSLVSTFQARGLYELHGASRSSERLRRTTRITYGLCGFGLRNASLLWRVRGFAVPSAVCIQRRQVFGVRGGKTSVSSLETTVV